MTGERLSGGSSAPGFQPLIDISFSLPRFNFQRYKDNTRPGAFSASLMDGCVLGRWGAAAAHSIEREHNVYLGKKKQTREQPRN